MDREGEPDVHGVTPIWRAIRDRAEDAPAGEVPNYHDEYHFSQRQSEEDGSH